MSETHSGSVSSGASSSYPVKPPLVKVGGGLGIAACCVGLAIFLVGCFGFSAVFGFAVIPLLLAIPALALSIIGGARRDRGAEDTQVLAAIAVSLMGLVGSLLLIAAWRGWPLFYGGGG